MKCVIYYRIIIKPMSSEVERRDGCKYLFIVFLQSGLPSNHICIKPICTCCCYLRIWPLVTPTFLCSSLHSILCTSGAYASKSMLSLYNVPSELVVWAAASIVGHCIRAIICIIILSCSFVKEETAQDKKRLFWSLKSNKEFFHHIKP